MLYSFGGLVGETSVSEHIAKVKSKSNSTIVPPVVGCLYYTTGEVPLH